MGLALVQTVVRDLECPLWVKSRHPTPWAFMSAIGGKADIREGLTNFRAANVRYWGLSGRFVEAC